MEIQEHIPLAPLTTFCIGGPAAFFTRATTLEEIQEALGFAKEKALAVFILGGGSNTLFPDEGFDGLVVKIEITGISLEREAASALLRAGAGESWDGLVVRAVEEKLWGIENLSAIPGTVGGAVVQNIGAYGAALSQTVEWVEVFDTQEGTVQKLSQAQCAFGYRDSVLKHEAGRYIVLRAAFRLPSNPSPDLSYKDLAERFKDTVPVLADIREAVIEIRKNKFPDLAQEGTAGSFFKNPVVPQAQAKEIAEKYPGMPLFAIPESSDIKVPIAWLLDYRHGVLDMRDVHIGGARMFERQPLVIAAARNSSSNDVRELAALVQKKIKQVCGIVIEPEVHIV